MLKDVSVDTSDACLKIGKGDFPSGDGLALSFEEAMAPIAEDFTLSGMTEEDLDALVEQERQAMWNEKHS
jgi:hypothetical protein